MGCPDCITVSEAPAQRTCAWNALHKATSLGMQLCWVQSAAQTAAPRQHPTCHCLTEADMGHTAAASDGHCLMPALLLLLLLRGVTPCRMAWCWRQTRGRRLAAQWRTRTVRRSTTSHQTSTAAAQEQQQTQRTSQVGQGVGVGRVGRGQVWPGVGAAIRWPRAYLGCCWPCRLVRQATSHNTRPGSRAMCCLETLHVAPSSTCARLSWDRQLSV